MSKLDKKKDKELLTELIDSLNVSHRCLRKDECGDWTVYGHAGKISTDSEWWYVYCPCGTPRKWTNAKKVLSFMILHQDGDDEGILKLGRFPIGRECDVIRKVIKLSKKRKFSPEHMEKMLSLARTKNNSLTEAVN